MLILNYTIRPKIIFHLLKFCEIFITLYVDIFFCVARVLFACSHPLDQSIDHGQPQRGVLLFHCVGKGRKFAQVRFLFRPVYHITPSNQSYVLCNASIVPYSRHAVLEAEASLSRQIKLSAIKDLVTETVGLRSNAH